MSAIRDHYPDCAEALIVAFARDGDDKAFAELIRRRQSSIRNMMRRLSGDDALADDLAQQVFMKGWKNIHRLKQAGAFGGWLKRVAISIWLEHLRKRDALRSTRELVEVDLATSPSPGVGLDLDRALATLSEPERLCVVLSYHAGMSHREIAELTDLPLGTTKSHIARGTKRLRHYLAPYNADLEVNKS